MTKPKVLFTDGEGPIVFKDLAADMMEKTVPGLFSALSIYDDYLAEVGTAGYQAGDTLALVAPHFLAHGVTDEDIAEEARDAKVCLGVEEYISGLKRDGWDIRIISTAYSQMWKLVGEYVGIPMKHIACTNLNITSLRDTFDSVKLYERIRQTEQEVLANLPLWEEAMDEVNKKNRSVVDVLGKDSKYSHLKESLDNLYWRDLSREQYHTLEAVRVIGGRRKVEAAQKFAQELGVSLSDVAYVGDSITDDAMHARLSTEGGLPIAINGNNYALRNARVAVATKEMQHIRPVLDAWQQGGFEQVQRFVRLNSTNSLRNKEGAPISEGFSGAHYDLVEPSDQVGFLRIIDTHREYRRLVRGAATARLG